MNSRELTNQALSMHQSGQLQKAEDLYKKAIELNPRNSDATQFFGLLLFQRGNHAEAITYIKRAIDINPEVAPYYDNLGVVLEANGQYQRALDSYKTAAEIDHEDPDRYFNTAIVLEKLNLPDEAEASYRSAIRLKPDDCPSHFNLGNLLKNQGDLETACQCYERAAQCNPVVQGTYNNLGNTLLQLGQFDRAVETLEQSLKSQPQEHTALLNLAIAKIELGQLDYGADRLKQYSSLNPDSARARSALGRLEMMRGNQQAAIRAYIAALDVDPDNQESRFGLSTVFRTYNPSGFEAKTSELLLLLFEDPKIVHQSIARLAASQIRHQLHIPEKKSSAHGLLYSELQKFAGNRLLLELLVKTTNTDPALEFCLKALRKQLLHQTVGQKNPAPDLEKLCTAIANQCFTNEYLYSIDPEENALLQTLEQNIDDLTDLTAGLNSQTRQNFAAVAMFRTLERNNWVPALSDIELDQQPVMFKTLITRSIQEPARENILKSKINQLSPIENTVSNAVREQYEQNPYPRWFKLPERPRESYYQHLRHLFPHFDPPAFLEHPVSVLNAGCGTGQETAMISQARLIKDIVGLDLSVTSLAHGQRMVDLLQIESLSFIQGDILQCHKLDRHFSVIESTGVLHHMQDPVAGWRALLDCLRPHGVMKVGLYSALASVEVNHARQIIQQRHLDTEADTIRKFREEILSSPKSDPLYALRHSEDFYSISACRDLLFHVQEQSYTLPQLAQILQDLNLKFIGFELPDPKFKRKYSQQFAQDDLMVNLDNWDKFEKKFPETFAAMYVFWCQKI